MSQPVQVPGGTVYLRDRLDFAAGQAVRYAIGMASENLKVDGVIPDDSMPDLMAIIAEAQVLRGVESWTFPEPVTRPAIRELLLENDERAMLIANAADSLYQAQVLNPLVQLALSSSPPTPTGGSTSVPNGSASTSTENGSTLTRSPRRQKPSKRSSTTTSLTGATMMTSSVPGGASSS